MPSFSRAWFVDRYGGPERLVLRERPDPTPGPGEVLVRTAAIGLNFADLFVRSGDYPRTPKPPFVPGMEVSGTVEAVGAGVANLSPGQRVVAVPIFGGHAEKVLCPAARVFPLPEGVDLSEAAAMPVVFLTAWYALTRAEVTDGHAGRRHGGGRRRRARRCCSCSRNAGRRPSLSWGRKRRSPSAASSERRRRGLYGSAEDLIDRAFGGRADVVVDAVGGRLFRRLWRRLDFGGRYVLYGFAAAIGRKGNREARGRPRASRDGVLRALPVRRDLPDAHRLQSLAPAGPDRRAAGGGAARLRASGRPAASARSSGPAFPSSDCPTRTGPSPRRGTTGKVTVVL